jgi:hypothetical protein
MTSFMNEPSFRGTGTFGNADLDIRDKGSFGMDEARSR